MEQQGAHVSVNCANPASPSIPSGTPSASLISDEQTELLIEEIEKRPALYNKQLKDYSNSIKKRNLWEEVCAATVPDWGLLTPENKTKAGIDVQKKWQNLRTCFSRELRNQKQTKSGQAASKRRPYVYFEKLLFLITTNESRSTESNLDCQVQDDKHDEEDEDEVIENKSKSRPKRPCTKKDTVQNDSYEQSLLNILIAQNMQDENVHFVLSLVPHLKSLDDDKNLEAKIQIMQVIKKIKKSTSNVICQESNTASPTITYSNTQLYPNMASLPEEFTLASQSNVAGVEILQPGNSRQIVIRPPTQKDENIPTPVVHASESPIILLTEDSNSLNSSLKSYLTNYSFDSN